MEKKLPNTIDARKRLDKVSIRDNVFDINPLYQHLGDNLKYFIRTYGCQANVRDSETIAGILESLGYKPAETIEDSDLVILNTCAIRENAELKVFGEIGFLKRMKKSNHNFKFGICGCMAQEESVIKKIIDKIQYIDFAFGTHNIYELPEILNEIKSSNETCIRVNSYVGEIVENLPSVRNSTIKAFVNITYGCDKFCSYCIVPYTRGKLRSRKQEDIINEIKMLRDANYKEVTLIGQNVNSYNDGDVNFEQLLENVAKTGIERVRFATSNPWNFPKSLVDVIAKYENIMPYVHLPIQSGDETILAKMNRHMKIEDYIDLVEYIRSRIPDCAISTDLIVGFPNETDEQFQNTIKLYEKNKFDNAYTFIYSKREGTPAALIEDKIPLATKEKRLEALNKLVKKYAWENCKKFIGRTIDVLVEGASKKNKNILFGYSPEWKVVNFKGIAKPGDIVKIKITSASRFSLNGETL